METSVDNSTGEPIHTSSPSCSRRRFLLGSVSAVVLAACQRRDRSTTVDPSSAGSAPRAYSDKEVQFLALSTALTGKPDLDPFVSRRILAALTEQEPQTVVAIPALVAVTKAHHDPAAILAAADVARPAALSIVRCWYTGTVGKGVSAVTVAYRDALMQRPVADGLFPQTYAKGGPGWWVATPPSAVAAS